MFPKPISKILPLVALTLLSACASYPNLQSRIDAIDVPAFQNTEIVRLDASEIVLVSNYNEDNKLSGDYGKNFAAAPYDVFADYFNARFEPTGKGEPLYIVIEQASLVYNREIDAGATSQDDDVYALELNARVLSGGTIQSPDGETRVKLVKTLRQRRDLTTKQQRYDGQIDYLARSIAEFDRKFIRALESGELGDGYHSGYHGGGSPHYSGSVGYGSGGGFGVGVGIGLGGHHRGRHRY